MAVKATSPTDVPNTEGPTVDGFRDAELDEALLSQGETEDTDASVREKVYDGAKRRYDQMATMNRLVTGGVTLAVGVLVYNEVVAALPNGGGAINQTAIDGTVESAFVLAPVALIVLISAFILAQVSGFRQT